MKIAYLSVFHPYRGGISQFNGLLYRIFEKRHQIKAYNFKRQYPNLLFPGQTQFVTETDNADAIPSLRILDTINPLSYFKTASHIKKYNPDLLISRLWMPFFSPSLGFVTKKVSKNGGKSIAILDNVIPHEPKPFDKQLIKYFLNSFDGFIAMSSVVKDDLLSFKPNAKYIVKPHPLYEQFGNSINRIEACNRLNIPTNKKIILFFGFIRDYKGLDLLIDAFKDLSTDYHLVIAGECYGSFQKYSDQIENNGIANRVSVFNKYINDNEVSLYFSAANVCVLPYKSATQSGIVQIAYSFNLPVIVTNVGGLSEMIDNNKTGIIINEPQPNKITEAINKYFDQDLFDSYSKAIALKRHEYSWEGFADAIEELYKQL